MYKSLYVVFTAGFLLIVNGASLPKALREQDLDGRIVGGVAVSISQIPWQVSLQRGGGHFCGGSIYRDNIIVTAAHCLYGADVSRLSVRAGTSYKSRGGVVIRAAAYKIHEGYNPMIMVNDVAIVRLSERLKFDSTIRPIELATKTPAHGALAAVSGWGIASVDNSQTPYTLQYVEMQIVSREECASPTYGYSNSIESSMICASATAKDSCQGDSGGPMVSDGQLVGVVSWGRGCAYPDYPGVYASVFDLHDWIVDAADTL